MAQQELHVATTSHISPSSRFMRVTNGDGFFSPSSVSSPTPLSTSHPSSSRLKSRGLFIMCEMAIDLSPGMWDQLNKLESIVTSNTLSRDVELVTLIEDFRTSQNWEARSETIAKMKGLTSDQRVPQDFSATVSADGIMTPATTNFGSIVNDAINKFVLYVEQHPWDVATQTEIKRRSAFPNHQQNNHVDWRFWKDAKVWLRPEVNPLDTLDKCSKSYQNLYSVLGCAFSCPKDRVLAKYLDEIGGKISTTCSVKTVHRLSGRAASVLMETSLLMLREIAAELNNLRNSKRPVYRGTSRKLGDFDQPSRKLTPSVDVREKINRWEALQTLVREKCIRNLIVPLLQVYSYNKSHNKKVTFEHQITDSIPAQKRASAAFAKFSLDKEFDDVFNLLSRNGVSISSQTDSKSEGRIDAEALKTEYANALVAAENELLFVKYFFKKMQSVRRIPKGFPSTEQVQMLTQPHPGCFGNLVTPAKTLCNAINGPQNRGSGECFPILLGWAFSCPEDVKMEDFRVTVLPAATGAFSYSTPVLDALSGASLLRVRQSLDELRESLKTSKTQRTGRNFLGACEDLLDLLRKPFEIANEQRKRAEYNIAEFEGFVKSLANIKEQVKALIPCAEADSQGYEQRVQNALHALMEDMETIESTFYMCHGAHTQMHQLFNDLTDAIPDDYASMKGTLQKAFSFEGESIPSAPDRTLEYLQRIKEIPKLDTFLGLIYSAEVRAPKLGNALLRNPWRSSPLVGWAFGCAPLAAGPETKDAQLQQNFQKLKDQYLLCVGGRFDEKANARFDMISGNKLFPVFQAAKDVMEFIAAAHKEGPSDTTVRAFALFEATLIKQVLPIFLYFKQFGILKHSDRISLFKKIDSATDYSAQLHTACSSMGDARICCARLGRIIEEANDQARQVHLRIALPTWPVFF